MSQDEIIDLNHLTQKELLILLISRMDNVERDLKAKSKIDFDLQLRVKVIEVKMAMWAFLGAGVVTGVFKIAEKLL